jgi:hypothetical protein
MNWKETLQQPQSSISVGGKKKKRKTKRVLSNGSPFLYLVRSANYVSGAIGTVSHLQVNKCWCTETDVGAIICRSETKRLHVTISALEEDACSKGQQGGKMKGSLGIVRNATRRDARQMSDRCTRQSTRYALYLQCNIEARSRNHCWDGKAISITHFCVCACACERTHTHTQRNMRACLCVHASMRVGGCWCCTSAGLGLLACRLTYPVCRAQTQNCQRPDSTIFFEILS